MSLSEDPRIGVDAIFTIKVSTIKVNTKNQSSGFLNLFVITFGEE